MQEGEVFGRVGINGTGMLVLLTCVGQRASVFVPKLIILAAIGLTTYVEGVIAFNKRDLPLY